MCHVYYNFLISSLQDFKPSGTVGFVDRFKSLVTFMNQVEGISDLPVLQGMKSYSNSRTAFILKKKKKTKFPVTLTAHCSVTVMRCGPAKPNIKPPPLLPVLLFSDLLATMFKCVTLRHQQHSSSSHTTVQ